MERKTSLAKVVIRYDGAVTSVKVDGKELGDKVSKVTFTQCGSLQQKPDGMRDI